MKDKIFDIIQTNDIHLDANSEYHLTIANSCIIGSRLKILFNFQNSLDLEETFNLVAEYVIGSQEYINFLYEVYCCDNEDALSVSLEDFEYFSAYCKGDAIKNGQLSWDKIDLFETPISSAWAKDQKDN